MRLISICLVTHKVHQSQNKIECLETWKCNIVSMRGSKMDEVTKILHLHTRIGYIQKMCWNKWYGTIRELPNNFPRHLYLLGTVTTEARGCEVVLNSIWNTPWIIKISIIFLHHMTLNTSRQEIRITKLNLIFQKSILRFQKKVHMYA